MEENHGIIKTYMRYSKRIAVFGMVSWVVTVAAVLGLIYWLSIDGSSFNEYVASVLRTVLSSGSGVAIATTISYLTHSSVENFVNIKQKINQLTSETNVDNFNGGGAG